MKSEVKTPAIVVAGVLLLGLLAFGVSKAMKAGDLDHGQVSYTPGVPPWMEKDPNKKSPGGPPPSGGPQGGPPGVTAPTRG